MPHFAVHRDVPRALFNDSIDSGKAETCSFAALLRSEKGFEESGEDFGAHPVPGVCHCHSHITPGMGIRISLAVLGIQMGLGDLDAK